VSVHILGTGHHLPGSPVGNDEIERWAQDFDPERAGCRLGEWVEARIGVRHRHRRGPADSVVTMAAAASRRALASAEVTADELDLIVLSSFTDEDRLPPAVSGLQVELATGAKCFQLDAACTGFVDAVVVASSLLRSGQGACALVVHSEVMSSVMDRRRFLTNAVFGDGAGAAIVRHEPGRDGGLLAAATHTDGSRSAWIRVDDGDLQLEHRQVFDFAIDRMASASFEVLAAAGHSPTDVDHVVAHQTGSGIQAGLAERLGIDPGRFGVTLDHTGNTSGATLPIALDELNRQGRLHPGQHVLMPAVGAGMAWGALYVRWTAQTGAPDAR
jgi:3-oxoacyl-[acyl-carrier-protein] synthase III